MQLQTSQVVRIHPISVGRRAAPGILKAGIEFLLENVIGKPAGDLAIHRCGSEESIIRPGAREGLPRPHRTLPVFSGEIQRDRDRASGLQQGKRSDDGTCGGCNRRPVSAVNRIVRRFRW